MTETTPGQHRRGRGRPWQPGQSGNPKGRPAGARHKTTLAVEALLDGEAEQLTRKAIEKAMAGDVTALRLCLDRIAPPRKDRLTPFQVPPLHKASDAIAAMAAVVEAVADASMTPTEAASVGRLVESFVSALETFDHEERISRIEQQLSEKR